MKKGRTSWKKWISAALFIALWGSNLGCSAQSEEKRPVEKSAGKPPVAVEASKARASDILDGIDVVGSLSPKFGADVRSEYT